MTRRRLPLPAAARAVVLEGLFSRLSFGLITFALPLYARHLGFSLSQIGLLVALNTAVSMALKPLTGWVADRAGFKRTLLAGIGLRSVVSGLFGLASAPWHLFAIRSVHGISMSLRDPSVNALIAETGGERQVASAFAWYQTAKSLAGQLSKSAAGFLLSLTGANYPVVFFVAFGLSVLPALVVARFVPDDRRQAWGPSHAGSPGGAAPTPAERPKVLPFMGLGFLINATADMLDGLVPIIATEYAGLTTAQTGLIYTVASVVLVVSGPLFGWLADNVSASLVLPIRGAANALSAVVYVFAPSFPGVMSAKALDDLGKAAYQPAWGALMAYVSSFDRRNRARTISFLTVGEDLGSVIAPVFAGLLWTTWGLAAAMGARVVLALVTELYAFTVARPGVARRRPARAALQTEAAAGDG